MLTLSPHIDLKMTQNIICTFAADSEMHLNARNIDDEGEESSTHVRVSRGK